MMTTYYLLEGIAAARVLSDLKPQNYKDVVWLYGSMNAERASVSPILFQSDAMSPQTLKLLENDANAYQYMQRFESLGNLSFVQQQLKKIEFFETSDRQAFYLRYADPRVLSYLPEVLSQNQWADFASDFKNWSYINRDGEWQLLEVTKSFDGNSDQSLADGLTLSEAQFDLLIERSAVDQLLTDVLIMNESLANQASGSQLYQWAQKSHQISKNWGHYPAEQMLCYATIQTQGKVLQEKGVLNRTKADDAFVSQLFKYTEQQAIQPNQNH
jgi:hypothetical protein